MTTTVLDALENAKINFETVGHMGAARHPIYAIAMTQLTNAIKALENGIAPDAVIQENMFGEVNTGETP